MGTSANENIAIRISTTADVSGAQAARTETDKITVSAQQMEKALERTNGDLQAAARLAAAMAKEEAGLAVATDKATAAIARESAATERAVAATEKETGAQQRRARQIALLEIAAYQEDARRTAAMQKSAAVTAVANQKIDEMSPKLRTATNAAVLLSNAALTGQGSLSGLAVAAGNVAQGIAAMAGTARVAAAATGIGALVSVLPVIIALFEKFKTKVDEAHKKFVESIGGMANAAQTTELQNKFKELMFGTPFDDQGKLREASKRVTGAYVGSLADLEVHFADLQAKLPRGATMAAGAIAKEYNQVVRELDAARQKAEALRTAILNVQDQSRRGGGLISGATSTATAPGAKVKDPLEGFVPDDGGFAAAINRTADFEDKLTLAVVDAQNKRLLNQEDYEAARAQLEYFARIADIVNLHATEDETARLKILAAKELDEKLTAIEKASADKSVQITKDRIERENEALSAAVRKQQAEYEAALNSTEALTQNALHAAVLGQQSLISAMTKALLEPLVRRLEALAIEQGIDALADLAFFNFPGAALHTAAAAAALAGAQKVAQIGGLSGSGVSVPSSSGGGGGGSPFTPRERERGGATVVNLYTTDPYNRENIMIASYQLERSRVTNRPIYIPPTNGLRPGSQN